MSHTLYVQIPNNNRVSLRILSARAVAILNKLGRDPAEAFKPIGQRAYEGWQFVKERRVKKYVFKPSGRVQWVVVGDGAEYIIYEKVGFCSCDDFFHIHEHGEPMQTFDYSTFS